MNDDAKAKEVFYHQYCNKCLYRDKAEDDDPCYDCLKYSSRQNSHRPVKFVERIGK